jgi:hypothetical protein
MTLPRCIIERDLPAIGSLEREQLRPAIARSKDAKRRLGPNIQWAQSYVSDHRATASIWQAARPLSESMRKWQASP